MMTNYREILRLYSLGLNKTDIAGSAQCNRCISSLGHGENKLAVRHFFRLIFILFEIQTGFYL